MILDPYVELYQGHVLSVLKNMPDCSVDMVMTSPPYYGLRAYKTEPQIWGGDSNCEHEWVDNIQKPRGGVSKPDNMPSVGENRNFESNNRGKDTVSQFCSKCNAWKGELGLEPTIHMYIDHLMMVFDEVKRVLKKQGLFFLNIADSYAGSGNSIGGDRVKSKEVFIDNVPKMKHNNSGILAKSLCGIPERLVISMTDSGWIRRNTIIWKKRNAMPDPVRDRFTEDFEYLYMFSKKGKYYFEQQFEEYTTPLDRWGGNKYNNVEESKYEDSGEYVLKQYDRRGKECRPNELGRNRRTVWDIPTESSLVNHFASFPEKLCETPILAGCPQYICSKCGKTRMKLYKRKTMRIKRTDWGDKAGNRTASSGQMLEPNEVNFIGYSNCGCGEKFQSGIVLDPFAGTGTTLAVAKRLGRKSMGIELNDEYCKLIKDRIYSVSIPMELNI